MHVYVLSEFLSPEECDAVVASFPRLAAPGAVNVDGAGGAVRALRKSTVSFAPAGVVGDLAARFRHVMRSANDRFFHFEISEWEPLQLARYGVGDGYGDHLDLGPGVAARRKLSASVQLTDSSEYDGGDLHVWGTGNAERARGTIVVFPSFLVHRVEPVTRGVRRSLVAWASGSIAYR